MPPGLVSAAATWTRHGLRALTDVCFPPTCALCGTPAVVASAALCQPCAAAVEEQCRAAYCPGCGRTVPPFVVVDGRCNQCREHSSRLAGIVRAGPYAPPFRGVVHAFKYQHRSTLVPWLGRRLTEELEQRGLSASVEALVTVPQWWLRRVRAGDYPPDVLARHLSRAAGLPVIPALRRVRGGPSQVGLTATERIRNVRGKFAVTRGVRIEGATLCLIDDVMTTGATLEECARVLRAAGARTVYAAVAAHVSPGTPAATWPRSP
jgi:ComF family protein